jgi:hypothetical protein
MQIYQSLQEYNKFAKIGDIIALGGNGLMNGLQVTSKNDCFTVKKLNGSDKFVSFTQYKGRTLFTVYRDQQVAVIDKKIYSNLPIY